MEIYQAIILGIVQGICEFLPISSSGHLVLIPEFFGWEVQDISFDAIVHLATLTAVIVALRKDIISLFQKQNHFLIWMIVVGTIPAIIFGLVIKFLNFDFRHVNVIIVSLVLWAIILYMADRFVKEEPKEIHGLKWKQAIWIGVAQAIALIPGTSRSGIVISAGLFSGLSRSAAARYAFLLGIPAIAAAGLLSCYEVVTGSVQISVLPLLVGFISAFVTGLFAIQFLLNLLKKGDYKGFALYRILLAIILILFIV
ncbi:MAG: undecaprenyl-diphosphatase UppP [Patescibacteria group bacterium]